MSQEQDDYRDEDEHEDYASRSIFSAGWFRAVLVLTVLAIIVVVSLPYLLNWFEPLPPTSQASAPAVTKVQKPEPAPASATSSAPAASVAPSTSPIASTPPSTKVADKPATPPPASAPAKAEKPAAPPSPPISKVADRSSAPPALPSAKPADKPAAPAMSSAVKPVSQTARAVAPTAPAREPVSRGPKAASAATLPSPAGGNYWVQIGVFKEPTNAEGLAKSLRASGFPIEVTRI